MAQVDQETDTASQQVEQGTPRTQTGTSRTQSDDKRKLSNQLVTSVLDHRENENELH